MSAEIIRPFPKRGPRELLEETWTKQGTDRHADQSGVKLKTKEPKTVKEICSGNTYKNKL